MSLSYVFRAAHWCTFSFLEQGAEEVLMDLGVKQAMRKVRLHFCDNLHAQLVS